MDSRENVLEGQAARVLAEITRLEAELDSGQLLVTGSTGQVKASPVLGELRAHRWLLCRLLSDGPVYPAGPPVADAVDQLRQEWENSGAL
jgi:hypothetical protein